MVDFTLIGFGTDFRISKYEPVTLSYVSASGSVAGSTTNPKLIEILESMEKDKPKECKMVFETYDITRGFFGNVTEVKLEKIKDTKIMKFHINCEEID